MEHNLLSQLPREILESLLVAGLAVTIEQTLNFPGKIRAAGSGERSCGLFSRWLDAELAERPRYPSELGRGRLRPRDRRGGDLGP